jgi:hypothetical protein
MKVVLEDEVFERRFQERWPLLLSGVFHECGLRRHVVTLDSSGPNYCRWLEARPELERDEVLLVVDTSCELEARLAIDCVVVASTVASDWSSSPPRVGPEELLRVVSEPLSILVENGSNDGAFLRCMGFGFDRRNLLTAHQQGRVSFDLGGGSSAVNVLETRGARERYRTWFVFDSDALTPQQQASTEAKSKVETCKRLGLQDRHHRLKRRAAENYLAPEALSQAWPHIEDRKHQRALAFARMTPAQRAHYNLSGGFGGDEKRLRAATTGPSGSDAAHKPDVEALYASVPAQDRDLLTAGFGKEPLRSLFNPGQLPDELRRKDGQEEEMGSLIRRILHWL